MRIAHDADTAQRVVTLPAPIWLGLTFAVFETALSLHKRARTGTIDDRGSMATIWITVPISITASLYIRSVTPWAVVPMMVALRPLWLAVFLLSLALRAWSIVHLGRFFTVNVAVAADQVVIDDGPYRWVRHPSYTGVLGAFLGYSLYAGHWIGLLVVMVPVSVTFWRRILVEEDALSTGLGQPYRAYMLRTKRLVPFVF